MSLFALILLIAIGTPTDGTTGAEGDKGAAIVTFSVTVAFYLLFVVTACVSLKNIKEGLFHNENELQNMVMLEDHDEHRASQRYSHQPVNTQGHQHVHQIHILTPQALPLSQTLPPQSYQPLHQSFQTIPQHSSAFHNDL